MENVTKTCRRCGITMKNVHYNTIYCLDCKEEKKTERAQKAKEKKSQPKLRPEKYQTLREMAIDPKFLKHRGRMKITRFTISSR